MANESVSPLSVFKKDLFIGKVLFATGGGSGIAQGYGQVHAMMSLGCNAVILGRREAVITKAAEQLSKETGQQCLAFVADVRRPEALAAAVRATIDRFNRIDFVLCAAAGNFLSPIKRTSERGFATVIEIDLLGTYNTIKATLPHVKKTKGVYLHDSATLHYTGLPFQAHASAAKAGVDALSRVLAVEGGPFGVRSNVIAPGPIQDTEGFARLVSNDSGVAKRIPLQRYGKTTDIAASTVFLFSPAASWITGEQLVVDGGAWHLGSFGDMPYPDLLLADGEEEDVKAKL